jgi:hypothetical protein
VPLSCRIVNHYRRLWDRGDSANVAESLGGVAPKFGGLAAKLGGLGPKLGGVGAKFGGLAATLGGVGRGVACRFFVCDAE